MVSVSLLSAILITAANRIQRTVCLLGRVIAFAARAQRRTGKPYGAGSTPFIRRLRWRRMQLRDRVQFRYSVRRSKLGWLDWRHCV